MASSKEEATKALLKCLVACAEDASNTLADLVQHGLDHMHDEEILSRTLFAMKERLELLQQDALEDKAQAFPESLKYEGDDISVEPRTPSTPRTVYNNSDEDVVYHPDVSDDSYYTDSDRSTRTSIWNMV